MADPRVSGAAPFIHVQAMLTGNADPQGALVTGILPGEEPKVSVIGDKMKSGTLDSLQPGGFHILLGQELAAWLRVGVGDSVVVTAGDFQGTPMGAMPNRFSSVTPRPIRCGGMKARPCAITMA